MPPGNYTITKHQYPACVYNLMWTKFYGLYIFIWFISELDSKFSTNLSNKDLPERERVDFIMQEVLKTFSSTLFLLPSEKKEKRGGGVSMYMTSQVSL